MSTSETRPYPKILRTTEDADALLRAYAAEYEIKPFEALIVAIDRLRDPVESETLRASLAKATATIEAITAAHDTLLTETERIRAREVVRAADLESARVALDMANARTDRLAADLESAREATRCADLEVDRLTRELAAARQVPAREPCACALPDELKQRVQARIAARPGRDFAFVVKNGCDRLEGSDRYVDKKKAERVSGEA